MGEGARGRRLPPRDGELELEDSAAVLADPLEVSIVALHAGLGLELVADLAVTLAGVATLLLRLRLGRLGSGWLRPDVVVPVAEVARFPPLLRSCYPNSSGLLVPFCCLAYPGSHLVLQCSWLERQGAWCGLLEGLQSLSAEEAPESAYVRVDVRAGGLGGTFFLAVHPEPSDVVVRAVAVAPALLCHLRQGSNLGDVVDLQLPGLRGCGGGHVALLVVGVRRAFSARVSAGCLDLIHYVIIVIKCQ